MRKRLRSNRGLSAQQAHQALSVLIHDGKVKSNEVWNAVNRHERLVRELRDRLAAFEGGAMASARRVLAGSPRKRRKVISVARRAAMKAHGRYLAAVRPLSKADRRKVKAIREQSGVGAAIAVAKRMAK